MVVSGGPGEFHFCRGASAADIRAEVTADLSGELAQQAQHSVVPLKVTIGAERTSEK
jgi:hypothetical protein